MLDVSFLSLSCRFLGSGADVTGAIWSAQDFRQVWWTFLGLLSERSGMSTLQILLQDEEGRIAEETAAGVAGHAVR